jgi:hypothetical protein
MDNIPFVEYSGGRFRRVSIMNTPGYCRRLLGGEPIPVFRPSLVDRSYRQGPIICHRPACQNRNRHLACRDAIFFLKLPQEEHNA